MDTSIYKYFDNHTDKFGQKDLFIRIREDRNDSIYYDGIKIFDIDKNSKTLKISDNVFNLNKATIKEVIEEIKKNNPNLSQDELEVLVKEAIINSYVALRSTVLEGKMAKFKNIFTININLKRAYDNAKERKIIEQIWEYLSSHDLLKLLNIKYVTEYKVAKKLDLEVQNIFKDLNKYSGKNDKVKYMKVTGCLNIADVFKQMDESATEYLKKVDKSNYQKDIQFNDKIILEFKKDFSDKLKEQLIIYGQTKDNNVKGQVGELIQKDLSSILEIEYVITRNCIFDAKMNYDRFSGSQKPIINIITAESYQLANYLDNIEDKIEVMKQAINNYQKYNFEEEKNYQHHFMTDPISLLKIKHELPNEMVIYPFEEEYFIKEGKKKDEEENGRIDAILLSESGSDIFLIELKVNDNVIDGTNGVHKHLIDIEELFKTDLIVKFLGLLKGRIDYRRLMLGQKKIEWPDDIKMHFWTIIACTSEDTKENIKTCYLEKFKDNTYDIRKIKVSDKSKIKALREYQESIKNCDIRFFFDRIDMANNDIKIKNDFWDEFNY